jgi:hypothetical protein
MSSQLRAAKLMITASAVFALAGCGDTSAPNPVIDEDTRDNGFHTIDPEWKDMYKKFDVVQKRFDAINARFLAITDSTEYLPESILQGRPATPEMARIQITYDIGEAFNYQAALFDKIKMMTDKPDEKSLSSCHKLKNFIGDGLPDFSPMVNKLYGNVWGRDALKELNLLSSDARFIESMLASNGVGFGKESILKQISLFDTEISKFADKIDTYEANAKAEIQKLDQATLKLHSYRVQVGSMLGPCKQQVDKLNLKI